MAIELKKFFNTVIKTTSAHNLTTGAIVRITRTDNNLNGNNYYVKVLSSTSFSLYYDSSLTKIVGTDSLNITSSATIIPLFVTSLTYTYGFPGSGGGGGGGSSTSTTTFAFSTSITTNIQNFNLNTALVAAGWNGTSAVVATISIDAGIYIWSDDRSLAALTVTSLPASSTVSILNNGFIIGKGGVGTRSIGGIGGPAMSLNYNITLTNNSYVAGGGGGGGSGGTFGASGGGGAGGGAGINANAGTAIAGGAPGSVGNVGDVFGAVQGGPVPIYRFGGSGASGGRILPGTGGTGGPGGFGLSNNFGGPGGAGGGGGGFLFAGDGDATGNGGAGGSSANAGNNASGSAGAGGGGGGWGAAGGTSGGAGGKAINLNGYSVTYIVTGTLYGAVS